MTNTPSPTDEYDDVEDLDLDHDFDAAWATLKPKRVRVLGKIYTLPPERPAKVMILLFRERKARKEQDGAKAFGFLEEILETMFGAAPYQQILADGLGMDTQLRDLVDYCMNAYNAPATPQEDEQGEAEPPKTGAKTASATGDATSSATGRSSKRTSRASTRSTSSRRSTTA
ncbi:hypothetical protein [Streptosporangium sp. G12]